MKPLSPLLGLVLAGGQSRRMGADKATLSIGGNTLLNRIVTTLRGQIADVYVSVAVSQADEPVRKEFPLIEDRFTGVGPAAGILSAHLHNPGAAWLVVACDMPMLDSESINELIAARSTEYQAAAWISADGSGPEPLCAIYEPATLAAFLVEVQAGGNPSPKAWLRKAKSRLLSASRPEVLDGANTREEFLALSERLHADSAGSNGKTND